MQISMEVVKFLTVVMIISSFAASIYIVRLQIKKDRKDSLSNTGDYNASEAKKARKKL